MDTKYKVGDRVLVEAIIERVADVSTNWPIKIVLNSGGEPQTIDHQGNVHFSVIRGIIGAASVEERLVALEQMAHAPFDFTDMVALFKALAVVEYLGRRSERAQGLIPWSAHEEEAYTAAVRVVEAYALRIMLS